jgi:hypothetical protein
LLIFGPTPNEWKSPNSPADLAVKFSTEAGSNRRNCKTEITQKIVAFNFAVGALFEQLESTARGNLKQFPTGVPAGLRRARHLHWRALHRLLKLPILKRRPTDPGTQRVYPRVLVRGLESIGFVQGEKILA